MQKIDGQPVYSATDLVGYLACEHLTALERAALDGLTTRPEVMDPELDVLRERGREHEQRYFAELVAAGREVVEIASAGPAEERGELLRGATAATEAAMARGVDVVYQATFFDGRWLGYADFLLRRDSTDRPSRWGPYHYEVADTKLARHVKASAVLQICSYIDQLTLIQGAEPEWLHVVLGGSAHATATLRVADYMAYYRAAKRRFEAAVGEEAPASTFPPTSTYPEPVDHCRVCRWNVDCQLRRRQDDHLSLVAGISRRQRRALVDRGVQTVEALGVVPLPMVPPLDGTSAPALQRVREQARIQVEGRREGRMKYELLHPLDGEPIDPERGLATLPQPSPGDLFFDIEGDPYAFEDGLEYLFGVMEMDGTWHAFWATDDDGTFSLDGEKRAFEGLVDFVASRLDTYPDAHVYHYAPYEPTALKRLMGRHATREDEVDRLLRGGAMVDLLRAVRQGLRASVESYSIKKLEPLYAFRRSVDLRDAGSSIVEFERFLQLSDEERPSSGLLAEIEAYNHDDVHSNRALRDWLEERRGELGERTGLDVPRPTPRDPEPGETQKGELARVEALAGRLIGAMPADPLQRKPSEQGRWLLAQLLSWHRREDKATYWQFHYWMGLEEAQLQEERDPIAGLEPIEPVGERTPKGKQVWRYRFPPQDYDLPRGADVYDPAKQQANPAGRISDWKVGTVVAVDDAERTIDIKRDVHDPHPRAVVPLTVYATPEQRASLFHLGEWVADHGIEGGGPFQAGRDLLLRCPPRAGQLPEASLRLTDETDLQAARRLALTLDRTTLAIQGPPGSGKTYAGARMVLDLVRAGKRVGVCALSHKVVGNMLREICRASVQERFPVSIIQKAAKHQGFQHEAVDVTDDNAAVRTALSAGIVPIAAGTPWLWARADMRDSVDVLFVDEAGQMSLANVVAISPAAASVVLLGDPQQLDQPLQGSHPVGAERSALAHLLGHDPTIRPEQGLFLETTWRLHPDLCDYTSEVFYEGRVTPEPHLARQHIVAPDPVNGTGPRLLPVAHAGNDNESPEEADAVAALARAIVDGGSHWVNEEGLDCPVMWDDILIVAPYNAQVGAIQRLLPDSARVGTVDKFQGQEAPVSIYSMASSSADDAPRGMDFLYSRNRLNVATSRARCVAVVVASPDLLRVRARTPEQMRLANALCRFEEVTHRSVPGPEADDAQQLALAW
jgi:predicted RecB family nuclease